MEITCDFQRAFLGNMPGSLFPLHGENSAHKAHQNQRIIWTRDSVKDALTPTHGAQALQCRHPHAHRYLQTQMHVCTFKHTPLTQPHTVMTHTLWVA